jgi:hypothetical protein
MASYNASSPLLALPRELRDDILGYLSLPAYVYTSTTTKDTHNLYQSRRSSGETYVDTRICLPSHPPANILGTCRQLRQECLEHHVRLLNSQPPEKLKSTEEKPMSNVLAARLGAEFAEEAERACDDGTLRITLEIQRSLRGPHGYYTPVRDELSPRFLALLPLMNKARKLRLTIWPGYDWWNGGPQPFYDKRGNARINPGEAAKPNAASVAISTVLQQLPHVEELVVDVLMQAEDGGRWDLPDRKWENLQPWLDSPITPNVGQALKKINRNLTGFWKATEPEPFYVQHEMRQGSGNTWKVERKGDMVTVSHQYPTLLLFVPRSPSIQPTMKSFLDTGNGEDLEFFKALAVQESYVRTD